MAKRKASQRREPQQQGVLGNLCNDEIGDPAVLQVRGDAVSWEDLDNSLLETWDRALIEKGNAASTRARKFAVVQAFTRSAVSDGLVPFDKDVITTFKKPVIEVKLKLKLFPDQIQALSHLEAPRFSVAEYARDTYLFSFIMRGVRFRDVVTMRWEHLHKSGGETRWDFSTRKRTPRCLRGEEFIEPIHDRAGIDEGDDQPPELVAVGRQDFHLTSFNGKGCRKAAHTSSGFGVFWSVMSVSIHWE